MKKMMVSIKPLWLEKILKGEKEYEFRNWKVPVGTVIYFYCSKTTSKQQIQTSGVFEQKVSVSGVVEQIVETKNENFKTENGFTNQKFAIKIKELKVFEPLKVSQFKKSNGKPLQNPPQSRVWLKK